VVAGGVLEAIAAFVGLPVAPPGASFGLRIGARLGFPAVALAAPRVIAAAGTVFLVAALRRYAGLAAGGGVGGCAAPVVVVGFRAFLLANATGALPAMFVGIVGTVG